MGGPAALCETVVKEGDTLCTELAVDTQDDCLQLEHPTSVGATVASTTCTPSSLPAVITNDMPTLQGCEIAETDGCAVVPSDFIGPCVIGGSGTCPSGYVMHDGYATVDGCESCNDGCETAGYCATVTARLYNSITCNAGTEGDPVTVGGSCHANLGGAVALRFSSDAQPDCGVAATMTTHYNVCCVP
jgi:hypothetical protein